MHLWSEAVDWLKDHPTAVAVLSGASLLMFLVSLLLLPWILRRIPADYFEPDHVPLREDWFKQPGLLLGWIVLKNILAVLLVVCGILMLFLPGQGLLTLLAGIFLSDLPFRRSLLHAVLRHKVILRPVNALRHRHGLPPIRV